MKLELDKGSGSFISRLIAIFSKDESNFIATMLVGNNIALVIFSISMTKLLDDSFLIYSLPDFTLLILQTFISTIIILVVAEFIPKAIFRINPNYLIRFFSIPLMLFYLILFPIVFITLSISELLLKYIFRTNTNPVRQIFSTVDLDEYLENLSLQNAIELSNTKVRECMVPRTDMIAINIKSPINELKSLFISKKYTKILIYKGNIDNIIGYAHSSDLFKDPMTIKSMMLPIPIVTESLPANEMLNMFINRHKSIALVVDEFGGTSGLVTIEDVTEEIVGDIEDEHDVGEMIEKKISDSEYVFSSRMEVDQINYKYNLRLPESEEYETIAGLFLSLHEDIPDVGDQIEFDNISLIIDDVDEKSIQLIRLVMK